LSSALPRFLTIDEEKALNETNKPTKTNSILIISISTV